MDNHITDGNVLDGDGHLIQELGTVEIQHIDVNQILGLGIIGYIGADLVLDCHTIDGQTSDLGIHGTEIKIELHRNILLFIVSSVDFCIGGIAGAELYISWIVVGNSGILQILFNGRLVIIRIGGISLPLAIMIFYFHLQFISV